MLMAFLCLLLPHNYTRAPVQHAYVPLTPFWFMVFVSSCQSEPISITQPSATHSFTSERVRPVTQHDCNSTTTTATGCQRVLANVM